MRRVWLVEMSVFRTRVSLSHFGHVIPLLVVAIGEDIVRIGGDATAATTVPNLLIYILR